MSIWLNTPVQYLGLLSYPGYLIGNNGSVWSCWTANKGMSDQWHQLSPLTNKRTGYSVVYFYVGPFKKQRRINIHTLVLTAFVGPRPPGLVARHFPDNNKQNNAATNLCWGTHVENQIDSLIHGTKIVGSHSSGAKLNEINIPSIRALLINHTMKSVADTFGVSITTVWRIKHNKGWKHVP